MLGSMATKSAGGRFVQRVTGELARLTATWSRYLNKPLDPRLSVVELVCAIAITSAVAGGATLLQDPAAIALVRGVPSLPAARGALAWMGGMAAVMVALLFLVELPVGARLAGGLLGAAVGGAAAEGALFAGLKPAIAALALALAAGMVVHVRCRKPPAAGFAVAVAAVGIVAGLRALIVS